MLSAGISSSLWLCSERAIWPLSVTVCSTSPSEPAVSNSSRCSFVGIVFHCMMTAAPRHRRTCSSIFATALLSSRSPRASSSGKHVCRTDHFVEIIRQPVLVLRQQALAFHRSLDFANFARDVSIFDSFSTFCHFRPKLLCREHGISLHGMGRTLLRSALP
jgi:hypothetical protein